MKNKFLILTLTIIGCYSCNNNLESPTNDSEANDTLKSRSIPAENYLCGDINGDSKDDLLLLTGTAGWYVSYNGTSKWTKICNSAAVKENTLIGDFNGDGEADIARPKKENNIIMIDYSCNNGWVERSTTSPSAAECLVGDVNNDGKDDLIWLKGTAGWYVSYSGTSNWTKICNSATVKENALIPITFPFD